MKRAGLPMAVALSGESPTSELLGRFAGVGLVRGEYVFPGSAAVFN